MIAVCAIQSNLFVIKTISYDEQRNNRIIIITPKDKVTAWHDGVTKIIIIIYILISFFLCNPSNEL